MTSGCISRKSLAKKRKERKLVRLTVREDPGSDTNKAAHAKALQIAFSKSKGREERRRLCLELRKEALLRFDRDQCMGNIAHTAPYLGEQRHYKYGNNLRPRGNECSIFE